ncbi:MAG: LPS-assembly protein LptD, partial [Sedimentisphaerales bacterium]|nr:LPS-assembly protein LptD [Sedimentisphaerales bacterium]
MCFRLLMIGVLLLVPGSAADAAGRGAARRSPRSGAADRLARGHWEGADLHLAADEVLTHSAASGGHTLVFREGFSLVCAGRRLTSDNAVVWIEPGDVNEPNDVAAGYMVRAYLSGHVSGKGGPYPQVLGITEVMLRRGKEAVWQGRIGGELFVTAERKEIASPRGLPLFEQARGAFREAGLSPPAALTLPKLPIATAPAPGAPAKAPAKAPAGNSVFYAPLGEASLAIERTRGEGQEIVTVIGRAYVWWQEADEGGRQSRLFELEADSLVLWRAVSDPNEEGPALSSMQQTQVTEIYVSGDVLLREGQHTIRASELYYDLRYSRGLVNHAVMRSFDVSRNMPIYVRAKQLRQLDASRFEAEDVTVTTSEFRTPQISVEASSLRLVDVTDEAGAGGEVPESSYDAEMKDVRLKYYDTTLFGLPSLRSNLQQPEVPVKSVRVGDSSTFGTSVETQWFLSRILGLREPEGTDSTLSLDYYGERGPGGGVSIDYERENYFGRFLGYIIEDDGEDRLGRTRKNVEIDDETRGRLLLQHRQFLAYDWQLTAELSYLSDENFLEQYYRGEFNVGKEQETLLHLKRIEGNRGLSVLAKARVNDFQDQVEEVPSLEYHWTGQSFWNDRLLFFSDTQLSRYRYRFGSEGPDGEPDSFFAFTQTRNEIDLPLAVGRSKVVPFVAGTFAYEDGAGFQENLDGSPDAREDAVGIGEAGVRMSTPSWWRVYPDVESRLLDLHQLRHVITPSIAAVTYTATDSVADQRNTLDLGIYQRWQTK